MSAKSATPAQWYVMLLPAKGEIHPVLRGMADMVGGVANPEPHVTLVYYTPLTEDADLVAPLCGLHGPVAMVRAREPHNNLYRAELPTAYRNILLRVDPTPELRWWHAAIHAALSPVAMPAWPSWEEVRLHLHAVMDPAMDPPEALELLGRRAWEVTFAATRLVLSRRRGNDIAVVLDQPLAALTQR